LHAAEIAEDELLKQASSLKFLDGTKRRFARVALSGRHQIEDLDLSVQRAGLLEIRFPSQVRGTGRVSGMNRVAMQNR